MSKEDINILKVEREPEVRDCYEIHKRLGIELYGSSLKLLENNLFSLCDQYVIRKCRFSYKFVNIKEKGLRHDVMWINPKYKENWSDGRIRDQVNNSLKYKNRKILKIWENEVYLRSVRTIRHYHILSMY
tara:strand:- start:1672 stop:2061 length:390 start_codon:yes stop_codon:yes gene_type:complete